MPQAGPQRLFYAPRRPWPTASATVGCASCPVRHRTFCGVLDLREIDHLPSITVGVSLPAHRTLFHEQDAAEFVYNLTRGTVKLFRLMPDGRCQIVGFVQAGDFLGLASKDGYSYAPSNGVLRSPRRRQESVSFVRQLSGCYPNVS